jgi:hypothetical protein
MFISIQSRRLPAAFALIALAVVGVALAVATSGATAAGSGEGAQSANQRSSERLVVRGEDTVTDGGCVAGVCEAELTDGAFRGTPVGTGGYSGTVELKVAELFANGEGGVCAPIKGSIVLGAGTPDRLILAFEGDSCQDGAGDPAQASFTNVAQFVVKHGTGAYAKAKGGGLASFSEDATDREHMTLIGRISR